MVIIIILILWVVVLVCSGFHSKIPESEINFLIVLEAGSSRSKYQQGVWFFLRPLSLVDGCLLTVSARDLSSVNTPNCVYICSFYKATCHNCIRTHPKAFILTYLRFKDPFPNTVTF